jgi:hypothetical protein
MTEKDANAMSTVSINESADTTKRAMNCATRGASGQIGDARAAVTLDPTKQAHEALSQKSAHRCTMATSASRPRKPNKSPTTIPCPM